MRLPLQNYLFVNFGRAAFGWGQTLSKIVSACNIIDECLWQTRIFQNILIIDVREQFRWKISKIECGNHCAWLILWLFLWPNILQVHFWEFCQQIVMNFFIITAPSLWNQRKLIIFFIEDIIWLYWQTVQLLPQVRIWDVFIGRWLILYLYRFALVLKILEILLMSWDLFYDWR